MTYVTDKRQLLRTWLRSKTFAPTVIAATLAWYDETVAHGPAPIDDAVLKQAESLAERIAGTVTDAAQPVPLLVRYDVVWWKIAVGAGLGTALVEGLRWLALALMRLPS